MAPEKKQPQSTSERDPFLAAIEAKIAAWTAAADSYKAAKALDSGLSELPSLGQGGAFGFDLPVGVFRGKGVKEAVIIYLEASRRKQTNKEIATGLKKGGIATTSANFEATVSTALLRLREEGVVLRFPDGWDLAASYPDSLRNRLAKGDGKSAKKVRGKTKSAPRHHKRKAEARTRSKPQAAEPKVGLESRITTFLRSKSMQIFTPDELATQFKVSPQVMSMTLARMARRQALHRYPDGKVIAALKQEHVKAAS